MHENEVFVLITGSLVLVFLYCYYKTIQGLPAHRVLVVAYLVLWFAWFSSVLEHFLLYSLFNFLEHLGYAINGLLLFIWCWIVGRKKRLSSQSVHD